MQPQTVSIFLEDGHRHAGEAEQVIRNYKFYSDSDPDIAIIRPMGDPMLTIGGYGRLAKDTAPPLWAADLISYSVHQQIVRKSAAFARIVEEIEEKVPIVGMCLDESRIELIKETCEAAAEENKQTHQTVKFFQQFGVKARKRKHGVEFDLSELTDDQRKALDKALN